MDSSFKKCKLQRGASSKETSEKGIITNTLSEIITGFNVNSI